MRLLRALPERFRRRAKRTFARRETDVDRLRPRPSRSIPRARARGRRVAAVG
jgi:hypothetical protein